LFIETRSQHIFLQEIQYSMYPSMCQFYLEKNDHQFTKFVKEAMLRDSTTRKDPAGTCAELRRSCTCKRPDWWRSTL